MKLSTFFNQGGVIITTEDVTVIREASGSNLISPAEPQAEFDDFFENYGEYLERVDEADWRMSHLYTVEFNGRKWRDLTDEEVIEIITNLEEA